MFVHSQSTPDFSEEIANRFQRIENSARLKPAANCRRQMPITPPIHLRILIGPSDMEVVKKMSKSCQKLSSVATVGRVAL